MTSIGHVLLGEVAAAVQQINFRLAPTLMAACMFSAASLGITNAFIDSETVWV